VRRNRVAAMKATMAVCQWRGQTFSSNNQVAWHKFYLTSSAFFCTDLGSLGQLDPGRSAMRCTVLYRRSLCSSLGSLSTLDIVLQQVTDRFALRLFCTESKIVLSGLSDKSAQYSERSGRNSKMFLGLQICFCSELVQVRCLQTVA
jgi:hypothetical protein